MDVTERKNVSIYRLVEVLPASWKFRFHRSNGFFSFSSFLSDTQHSYINSPFQVYSSSSSLVLLWLQIHFRTSLDDYSTCFLNHAFFNRISERLSLNVASLSHCDLGCRSHSARCCNGWEDQGGKSLLWVFLSLSVLQKFEWSLMYTLTCFQSYWNILHN